MKRAGQELHDYATRSYPEGVKLLQKYAERTAPVLRGWTAVNADAVANAEAIVNAAIYANVAVATNVALAVAAVAVIGVFVV